MSPPPRLLVIRRRYLGDIVLLSPFFRSLRQHWPNAVITLLAESAYAPVATLIPDVDRTLEFPRAVAGWWKLIRTLRATRFTHVFDLDNREKSALLTRVTGAAARIALLHEAPPRFPSCYTRIVLDPPVEHERRSIAEYYLQALRGAEVPVATHDVRLVPRESDLVATEKFFPAPGPRLLVHPGSRSAFRLWPAENFAAVCDRVQRELSARVFVIGGPTEESLVAAIRTHARLPFVTLEAPLSIPQFAAFASKFDALLCHDSGPMHLAAGVGTPVVALFGSQNVALWRPVGGNHAVLQAPHPCGAACVAPGQCAPADSYHSYCVRRISVDEVFAAVQARLARPAAARP